MTEPVTTPPTDPAVLDRLLQSLPDADNPIPFADLALRDGWSPDVLRASLVELQRRGDAEITYGRGWHHAE